MQTYNGILELLINRPQEVRDGWRPTEKSPTEFGEQLVCTALYWLSKNVVETSTNAGQYIDLFKQNYYGKDAASQKQAAYCAIFMWFIVDEAAKNMGCTHNFPGAADVWANAKNTLLQSEKRYRVEKETLNTPPTVGSIMFRHSTDSSSSGHMGIVIDVDTKNRTFDTIEGNVAINNEKTKEGVAAWRYRFSDVKTGNGIAFIHVEEATQCKNAKAKSYNGFECRPVIQQTQTTPAVEVLPSCIKKVGNNYVYYNKQGQALTTAVQSNGKWYVMGVKAGEGWVELNNCNYEYVEPVATTSKETPVPEKNYSPAKDTSTPAVDKVKKCRYNIVTVPPKSKLQHYSVLQDIKVLSDITGANIGNAADRNGSALWYNNRPDLNPGSQTGFGMFKDSIGNTIVVLDFNRPQSLDIARNGFLGYRINPENLEDNSDNATRNYMTIKIDNSIYRGSGWVERFTQNIYDSKIRATGGREFQQGGTILPSVYMPKDSNLNHVANMFSLQEKTLFGYLKEIENKGKPQPTPIVLIIEAREGFPSWQDKLGMVLGAANAVTGTLGIKLPPDIMKGSKALVSVFNGNAKGVDLKTTFSSMFSMAEVLAPETVKGVSKYVEDAGLSVGKYIETAGKTIKEYALSSGRNISDTILKNAQSVLGLDYKEIDKIYRRYSLNQPILEMPDLTKIAKAVGLGDVNKVVQNISNMLMVDKVKLVIESGTLATEIRSTASPLSEIPILQDLMIAGGSNAALSYFPKIEAFTSALLNSSQIKSYTNENPDILAALIGQNYGHLPTDKNMLKDLTIDALIGKAGLSAYANRNTPFVLPDSIEDEYKECYKFIIEQNSDAKVLWCPEGWEWDYSLRKCVNKTVSTGYNPVNTNNNTNYGAIDNNQVVLDTPIKTGNTGTNSSSNPIFTKDTGIIYNDWNVKYELPTETGYTPIKTIDPIKTTNPINPTPIKEVLPPCVVVESGEYYYYPNKAKTPNVKTVFEVSPSMISSVPASTATQLVRVELPQNNYVSLPGGMVSVPPTLRTPDGLPLPITLSDSVLPDRIRVYRVNTGTDKEAWYVRIDGVMYEFDVWNCQIIGYNPDKKVDIVVPDKIVDIPKESSEAEKINAKQQQEIKELEAKIRLQQEALKTQNNQPDERVIVLQKQLDQINLQNQQKENLLLEQIKQISNAKQETSPELIRQLEQSQNQIVELTKLVNERNKETASPNAELVNEVALLKKQIELEKQKSTNITQSAPQVQKAVEQCTDCDLARLPSRVITEYGNHYRRSQNNCDNDCDDCGCDE
jgi:cell division septum initiation protein DivIVA